MCLLRKSLHGLKQSHLTWCSLFSSVILSMDFVQCHSDHISVIHRRSNGSCVILLVYVNDIVLIGHDTFAIAHMK